MRKRPSSTDAIAPKPCGHPLLTFDGKTAPACQWGRDSEHAIPVMEPIGRQMFDAEYEHTEWQVEPGVGLRLVERPGMLGPDGEPWEHRREIWERTE